MMYGAETAIEENSGKKIGGGGDGCVVTKMDKIRNERIRGTAKVENISKKIQERRLQCYGHVKRREEEYVERRVMEVEVPGRRG